MFEDKTYENILDDMLENVPSDVDTREGSVIYDALAPIAMEIAQAYSDLSVIMDECFADTASYYYLIKRSAERGILAKEGTQAVVKIKTTPTDVDVPLGSEFNIGELLYTVTEKVQDGEYLISCEDTGTEGNSISDECVPVDYIEGLEEVEVVSMDTYGTDDEDAESLRNRYFSSFDEVAFGGNTADYKQKAETLPEVAACVVYPAWNGGGTVKLVCSGEKPDNHDFTYSSIASDDLQSIQEYFDGISPIGHEVTVESVDNITIGIMATITTDGSISRDDVIYKELLPRFRAYLEELRKDWDGSIITVRGSRVETDILSIKGVVDVSNVKVGFMDDEETYSSNRALYENKVPVCLYLTDSFFTVNVAS